MADQEEEQHSLASTFPNPPPFWKDFTPDRITRIEALRSKQADESAIDDVSERGNKAWEPAARLVSVPTDLINLQPPAEPSDGRWRVFGDQYMLDDKLPTLEDQGITNLPATHPLNNITTSTSTTTTSDPTSTAPHDRALELKRLTKSLLLNFLELTGTLSTSPSHAAPKIADLRTLLINTHHVINEYRPHQARESAIELMQDHLDRTRAETVAVRAQVEKARRVLEGLGSLGILGEEEEDGGDGAGEMVEGVGRREAEEELWKAADAVLT